jgi:hypothetical protein
MFNAIKDAHYAGGLAKGAPSGPTSVMAILAIEWGP